MVFSRSPTKVTSFLRRAALILVIFASIPANAQSTDPDYHIDYAPIMSRGFGVSDEPSMLDHCDGGYAGFRIFEHVGGRPLALVRVEKIDNGARITTRTFENGRTRKTARMSVSEAEWTELIDLIEKSGFWTYKIDEGVWDPEGRTMWIEACLKRQFRSISVYPERVGLVVDIVDFLSARTP